MKAIFIGSQNRNSQAVVDWLAERTEVVGVVWIHATEWQTSPRGRLAFARKRRRRYGLWKTLDETAFFLYYHGLRKEKEERELHEKVIGPFAERSTVKWSGDTILTDDINSDEVQTFLREREPDLALAFCINHFFDPATRAIPKHGVFLLHHGITPEYKGLYSPFWAVHNLDFDRIGYTLLRMNDAYDAGEIFAQGPVLDVDPLRHGHLYMAEKSVIDSLPAVDDFLRQLEAGTATAIDTSGREEAIYTYPGLSDLIRQRRRLRRWAANGAE
jgi:hypothetical protein